jgi:hypothetical protein
MVISSKRPRSFAVVDASLGSNTPPDSIFSETLDTDQAHDDAHSHRSIEESLNAQKEVLDDLRPSAPSHIESSLDDDAPHPSIFHARRLSLVHTVAAIVCSPKKREAAVFSPAPAPSTYSSSFALSPASPLPVSPLLTLAPSTPGSSSLSTPDLRYNDTTAFPAAAISDFSAPRVLGEGGAARVLLARHTLSGRVVALKRTLRSHDGAADHAAAELDLLETVTALAIPFVSRMLCTFEDDVHSYLVLVAVPPSRS